MAFLGPSLRRNRVKDRPVVRAVVAALFSLGLHAAVGAALVVAGAFAMMVPARQERVALAPLTPEQWSANRAVDAAPAPAVPPPATPPPTPPVPPARGEPPRPPEEKARGQVVDVAPSGEDRAPDSSRFLAERNNRVEKETRSRAQGAELFKNRASAPVRGAEKKVRRAGQGGADAETQEAQDARAARGGRGRPAPAEEKVAEQGDRVAMLDRPNLPRTRPDGRAGEGDDEGVGAPGPGQEARPGRRKAGDPNLLPSVESMSRIARAGPSNDALDDDVEEGDATALNTRAFRFATFWNRFKQDVADHWFPAVRFNMTTRDPQGATFGRRGWITELRIVLDRGGAVKDVEVIGPSGLDFLDRVAVKSVRDAAPFYNVPGSLLDSKGELAFEFGFLVGEERGIPVRPRYRADE